MPDQSQPILSVKNMSVQFPTLSGVVTAVKNVSFTVGREKVGIIGESGSGKSTTGRAIMRLQPKGAQVQILVSQGRAPVKVPNVIGKTGTQAREILVNAGPTIAAVDGDPGKLVIGTDPLAGQEVPYGTGVRIACQR